MIIFLGIRLDITFSNLIAIIGKKTVAVFGILKKLEIECAEMLTFAPKSSEA